jgi:hypothetical protein
MFMQMKTDSLPRFRRSELCEAFLRGDPIRASVSSAVVPSPSFHVGSSSARVAPAPSNNAVVSSVSVTPNYELLPADEAGAQQAAAASSPSSSLTRSGSSSSITRSGSRGNLPSRSHHHSISVTDTTSSLNSSNNDAAARKGGISRSPSFARQQQSPRRS